PRVPPRPSADQPSRIPPGMRMRGQGSRQGRRPVAGPSRPARPARPPRPPRPPAVLRLSDPRRRLNAGLIAMAFVLSLLAGRLVQLQGLDSKVLQAKAADQRVQPETLPARRGSITDIAGNELAVTVEAREIYLDPKEVDP